MLKKVLQRVGVGIVVGTFIGLMLSIHYSFNFAEGSYIPSTPAFIAHFPNELYALIASIGIWSAMGCVFSLSNLIYSETDWSILKMTSINFAVSYLSFLPLAILAGWTSWELGVLFDFTLTFSTIYIIIWLSSMLKAKKEIETLNRHLDHNK
ncbi:DUF3021 domain-containing protein [Tetragenococcus solitarius]|uniref:DUF3021 domain-containing protein n=1 Tax=Tetragenococcus solitarius TaxID=71453 RepID=A0ABP6KLH3_9ENTE|nr:DUF3021 domain-containing protein [Tetragenococcus solitarius]